MCLVAQSDALQPHGLQPARLLCPWGFSRQEYWWGLPCFPPGYLPNPGVKPRSPTLQADSLLTGPPEKPFQIQKKKKPIAWLCFAALSLMVYKAQEPVRWSQLLFVWSLLFLSASKRWWIWLTGEDYLQGELEKKKLVTVIADVPSWRRS